MPRPQCDVVCVGNLVADIFASPLSRLPEPGELALVDDLLLQTGGCAANTAASLARLGAKASVAGTVGNDVFGDFISRDLQERGVDVSGIRFSSTAPTSRTVILPVKGEDRRFVHSIGANAELTLADVDREVVGRARVLYVGGYLLLPRLAQADLATLFRLARGRGVKTVLDVAGARPGQGLEALRQVLPHTDVFLPNDDEARAITGESDPVRQTQIFVACGAGTAVVTMGSRGVVARTAEEAVRAPAFTVDVIDHSGAGDAFDAGFILGLLKGWNLHQTLEFASAIGASACRKLGCTAGVFTEEEAVAFLGQNCLEITAVS